MLHAVQLTLQTGASIFVSLTTAELASVYKLQWTTLRTVSTSEELQVYLLSRPLQNSADIRTYGLGV